MTNMYDKYGRQIDYIRISVTDRCNSRCIYCMPESGIKCKSADEILSYEEILKIVRAGAQLGIRKVRITGGEPLVRKDITFLIRELANMDGIEDVGLTTNGLLLSENINEIKNAGLKRINVSLDTLDREKYKLITRNDGLERVLEGIDASIKLGFDPVKINVVAMKGLNDDEAEKFAMLTIHKPLHVRFIEFMPISYSGFRRGDLFIPNDAIKNRMENLGVLNEENGSVTGSKYSTYRLEGAKGTVTFISPISKPFCSSCSRLRLTSDGKLRLCLSHSNGLNLKPVLRSNSFVFNDLVEIIRETTNLKPKSHYFNHGGYVPAQTSACQIGG